MELIVVLDFHEAEIGTTRFYLFYCPLERYKCIYGPSEGDGYEIPVIVFSSFVLAGVDQKRFWCVENGQIKCLNDGLGAVSTELENGSQYLANCSLLWSIEQINLPYDHDVIGKANRRRIPVNKSDSNSTQHLLNLERALSNSYSTKSKITHHFPHHLIKLSCSKLCIKDSKRSIFERTIKLPCLEQTSSKQNCSYRLRFVKKLSVNETSPNNLSPEFYGSSNLSLINNAGETHNRLNRVKRSKMKRSNNYEPRLQPPRDLRVVPVEFGTFNISWSGASDEESAHLVTHYQLILLNLNKANKALTDAATNCPSPQAHHLTDSRSWPHSVDARQVNRAGDSLSVNVSRHLSSLILYNLPPDNFYRLLLFAYTSDDQQRSQPATMPSSPRVPASPPETPPQNVRASPMGKQGVKISWSQPLDAGCTGELIKYVVTIKSPRLMDPILVESGADKLSTVVYDLISGIKYSVQVAASTRGGLGIASNPVTFRAAGEMPRLDLADMEGVDLPFDLDRLDAASEFIIDPTMPPGDDGYLEMGAGELPNAHLFMMPIKLHNLRATSTHNSIKLQWTVVLRQIDVAKESSMFQLDNNHPRAREEIGRGSPGEPLRVRVGGRDEQPVFLPPGTKYIVKWGDMHPGPFEDSVRGEQTQYVIENLRPRTIYYIRVITITPAGEGPAAYTVAITDDENSDQYLENNSLASQPLIPVNLIVHAVGSTWARLGWELRSSSSMSRDAIFQVKYYQVDQLNTGHNVADRSYELVNLTVQLDPSTRRFKTMLRGLRPATRYEFIVCLIHADDLGGCSDSTASSAWSMVQGFETFGQIPGGPPERVRLEFSVEHHHESRSPSVRFTLNWMPPSNPNGHILAYLFYLTGDPSKPMRQWNEYSVDGSVTELKLSDLQSNTNYYLRSSARNRFGRSSLSPVIVFHTPNAKNQGGGVYRLSKQYHDASLIDEPLNNFLISSEDQATVNSPRPSDENENKVVWIVLGSVIGGAMVFTVVILLILIGHCNKRRQIREPLKRFAEANGSGSKHYQKSNNPTGLVMNDQPIWIDPTTALHNLDAASGSGIHPVGEGYFDALNGCHLSNSNSTGLSPRLLTQFNEPIRHQRYHSPTGRHSDCLACGQTSGVSSTMWEEENNSALAGPASNGGCSTCHAPDHKHNPIGGLDQLSTPPTGSDRDVHQTSSTQSPGVDSDFCDYRPSASTKISQNKPWNNNHNSPLTNRPHHHPSIALDRGKTRPNAANFLMTASQISSSHHHHHHNDASHLINHQQGQGSPFCSRPANHLTYRPVMYTYDDRSTPPQVSIGSARGPVGYLQEPNLSGSQSPVNGGLNVLHSPPHSSYQLQPMNLTSFNGNPSSRPSPLGLKNNRSSSIEFNHANAGSQKTVCPSDLRAFDHNLSSNRSPLDDGDDEVGNNRVNVASSDYASQPSSLSTQSSSSSDQGRRTKADEKSLMPSSSKLTDCNSSLVDHDDYIPPPPLLESREPLLAYKEAVSSRGTMQDNFDDFKGRCNGLRSTSCHRLGPEVEEFLPNYSTEVELSQEMANLEGLMKDLNQITQGHFDC